VASLSQGRTAAAQCGLFTYKSVPVIFEPPCIFPTLAATSECLHSIRRPNLESKTKVLNISRGSLNIS